MPWIQDFSLVMRSTVTSFWDKVQDPERVLHQLLIDMEEELEAVRASVAGAVADEIQLGRDVDRERQATAQWGDRAGAALQRGDETGARAALDQKVLAGDRLAALEKEYARQKEQTAKLQRSLRDLEDKLRQARHKRTLLLARLAGAESERKIGQALDRAGSAAGSDSAFGQFRRLEAKVERTETMTEAYARLDGRDPDADELERQFAAQERSERLEAEFEALRRRVSEGGKGDNPTKAGAAS